MALCLLGAVYKTLSYRSFLARHANHTIEQIQQGEFETRDELGVVQERNLIRVLTTNIISETVGILEMLAALSMNADDPPEDRAMNIMTYRNWEISEFYDDISEETDIVRFKKMFSYPKVSDMKVTQEDEAYYESVLSSNAESYKEFYLAAKDTWNLLKPVRNKATHGFPLLMYDSVRPTASVMGSLPEGSDDILVVFNNSRDGGVHFDGLIIGNRPRESYLTIARNAAMIQGDLITGLTEGLRNRGTPVFPNKVFGKSDIINDSPETGPSYKLYDVIGEIKTEGLDLEIEKQSEYFEKVQELTEKHGE